MKFLIIFIALVFLLGLFSFVKNQKGNGIHHPAIRSINEAQLKERISQDTSMQFVDVRTALEYSKGHIKPAVNIDYMSKGFVAQFNSYNKEEPLYIYCRSGKRSGKAAMRLAEEGFTEIYDLEGGILEWNKSK
jgi:rhodanese-related sulfurtransferase